MRGIQTPSSQKMVSRIPTNSREANERHADSLQPENGEQDPYLGGQGGQ